MESQFSLLLFILSTVISIESDISKVKCYWNDLKNNLSFNLNDLVRKTDLENIYSQDENNLIAYSFCDDNLVYGGKMLTQTSLLDNNYQFKAGLSGRIDYYNKWSYLENDLTSKLIITQNSGEACIDSAKNKKTYTTIWNIDCHNSEFKINNVVNSECNINFYASAPQSNFLFSMSEIRKILF